ncbi:polysaccharide deacetylase family protein [Streptomyces sp. NPDC058613]|uniref:polysaccharide deacetylase family protein n=1 Tax=unclassified Streptomyces TaxID=2593676 RepID=UPI003648684D
MGIVSSSRTRRRTSVTVAAAVLGLLAAAGAPALAATDVPVGRNPAQPPAGPLAKEPAGTPAKAPGGNFAQAPAPYGVPLGISRLAEGADRAIAITIDDGPDPTWTPQVLRVLKENDVKATFCMIGTKARAYPDLVREVAAAGHRLCDHSVDHDVTMDHKPVAYQKQQILDAKDMIEKAAPGVAVDYYRAPGGAFTPDSRAIAAASGMRPLGWSVDPKDWSRPGLPAIVAAVENGLPRQPTVLFHDGGGDRSETVAALKEYLPWLTAHGYTFAFPDRTTP